MASIKQCTDKAGNAFYKVTASCGRGRRVTRSWHPEAGWSRKTIERELNKFAATLENSLQSNEVVTRQEQIEIDRQAAIEAAKLKTLRGLSQILCKHRNTVQIEQNLFKAEVAQAAAALFSK